MTLFSTFLYGILRFAINKFTEVGLIKYKSSLDQDMARHKAELDMGLEKHKADLSRITEEHKIRFEHLHLGRAEIIKNLHTKICTCEDALYHLTTLAQGPEWVSDNNIRHQNALNEIAEFLQAIRAARLFLPPKICTQLEELRIFAINIVFNMRTARIQQESNEQVLKWYKTVSNRQLDSPITSWAEAERKVREDFKENREQIESEFRKILGGSE